MNWVPVLFWTAVAVVVYAYAGYPIVVWCAARRRANPVDAAAPGAGQEAADAVRPFVSLVLAAYKEERYIVQRLHNALTQDYPADRLEIIVGCDGAEDCTGDLVAAFGDDRVRLMQFRQRRGKASVLNDCIPAARGDIVVLSDANTMMQPGAIRRLVRPFDNPAVGGVCGQLVLIDPASGCNADGLYWKYENFLKGCEARLGALLGANGGIYAIRKSLYAPLPANTIVDDFVIGMRIHARGAQLLYEPAAIAEEETPAGVAAEFHRRARIGAGGFQSLVWLGGLLHPRRGWLAFAFLSHKVLRWICPAFLIAALVSSLALAGEPFYFRCLAAQVVFYAAALAGSRLGAGNGWRRPLRLPTLFVGVNLALAVGFYRWLKGIHSGTWKRTERESQTTAAA